MNSVGANKRQRSPNYSDEEKFKFLELIRSDVSIIDDKSYDKESLSRKQYIWQQLYDSYNAQGFQKRTVIQLQNLWRDLKKKAKSAHANEKRSIFATGGGKNTLEVDAVSKLVIEILPAGSLEPLTGNINDNDAIIHEKQVHDSTNADVIQNLNSEQQGELNTSTCVKKMKYDVKGAAEAEHELKMDILRQRLKFDREEHEEKMKIYKLLQQQFEDSSMKAAVCSSEVGESTRTGIYMSHLMDITGNFD